MLTIKHINELGDQWLVEADDVTLIQPPGSKKSSPEDVAVLHIRKLDGVYEHLRNGVVYVMNSAGATVAVYHLANYHLANAAFDASDTAASTATAI